MKTFRTAVALFVFALVAAPSAEAQTSWELGPYAGFNLGNEEFLLGAISRIHIPTASVTLNPGFEFYPSIGGPGADVSLFVVNFDVQYQLEAESLEPYIGGGLFWRKRSVNSVSDSDLGLNLKGGLLFNASGNMQPYAEAVLALGGGSDFILKGGFLFTIG